MKRVLIAAAVGTIGAGLGVATFIGGTGTASAQECGQAPVGLTPGNIVCNIVSNGSSFAMSVSPQYNLGVLLNGTEDNPELGLLDQPSTFLASLQAFVSGPQAPGGPSPVDTSDPGSGGETSEPGAEG
jgi:hypothetical protein